MNIKLESINLPFDFNEEIYYKLNPDVYKKNQLNPEFTASFHYINHGYLEKRQYKIDLPLDFNEEIYYKLNPDVKEEFLKNPKKTASFHYLNYGYFENRQYKIDLPSDFDEEIYYLIHSDVKEEFLKDPKKTASNHYLNYGYFENKQYKINLINKYENLYKYFNNNHNKNQIIDCKKKFINITSYQEDLNFSKLNYNKEIFIKKYDYNNELIKIKQKYVDFSKLYILIIDFPNLGGGTSVFLKMIISKYKENVNFLIARNYKGYVKFTINDEYFIEKAYNNIESIEFVNNIINNITKIFINHLLDHSLSFLNNLFNSKKEITFITHDYYCITQSTQPFYEEIDKIYSNIDINLFNNIVTQNQINLNTIGRYISEKQNIIISPLPDFKNSGNYIQTNNENIVIGIIGAISDIKGKDIIKSLYDYILINKLNIKIIVFGIIYININNNIFEYENIYDLNNLLIQYKPNILLETSIWPETYSYTLTLSKLTQLPILSLKKPYKSVIENRLSDYNKVHHYSTLNDLIKLIPKIKQNFFYTIEPIVYFNSYWDNYFNTSISSGNNFKFINVENKNIVLITCKIIVSKNPFSYTNNRSVYTPEERFNQTLETINSIKEFIPNVFIVLFDNSKLDSNNYMYIMLKQRVDLFINILNNKELNYYTDVYQYKAFGDIAQQIEFYNLFLKFTELNKIKYFFKISGRYIINKKFNYSLYDNNKNIFKKNIHILDKEYYYTSFFKLDKSILNEYFIKLKNLLDNKDKYENKYSDCEVILPNLIIDKISLLDNLGITQRISVYGGSDEI